MRVTPQEGAPKKGGPRQVPRSPPLKHTTVHNTVRITHIGSVPWRSGAGSSKIRSLGPCLKRQKLMKGIFYDITPISGSSAGCRC